MASDVPPFEYLWIVKESAYGTPKNTPTAGVDSMYIRLDGANRMDMRVKKNTRTVPFGGGFDVRGYTVSDQDQVMGKLDVTLCYSQSQLLLDWGVTKISGGTTPWTTSEPNGDLASCSVYHAIMRDDGTIKRRQYAGVKVQSGKLSSSGDTGLTTLSYQLRAQRPYGSNRDSSSDPTSGAFAAPADTAFPTDPVLYYQLNGALNVNGSALLYPESIDLNWTNAMDARYFSSYWPVFDRLKGRQSSMDLRVLLTASPDWRTTLYEALTTMAANVSWTNGTHTVAVSYNANNIIDPIADDLTPGKVYLQTFTLNNQHDTSAGADITFTYT